MHRKEEKRICSRKRSRVATPRVACNKFSKQLLEVQNFYDSETYGVIGCIGRG